MATVLFQYIGAAVGGALGGPVGAAFGGAIFGAFGGYFDSQVLFPWLFGGNSFDGPRLNDLSAQQSAEGSPMFRIYGPQNRTAGTVIWQPDIIEEKKEERKGGFFGIGGTKITTWKYYLDIAIGIADSRANPTQKITRIWADTKVIYENGKIIRDCDGITFYDGTQTTNDPLIESYDGADDTAPYKGTAYIVINRLALEDYGRRVPNFTFEVYADNDVSAQDVLSSELQYYGLDPSEFDVTRVNGCIRGFVISGVQEGTRVISPVLLRHQVSVQEVGEKLVFFTRGDEVERTITSGDLAAHEITADTPFSVEISDESKYQIPTEIAITHLDPEKNLQATTTKWRRQVTPDTRTMSIQMPFTMTSEEAKRLAKLLAWTSEAERQKVSVSLPPSYTDIDEGIALLVPYNNETLRVRVDNLDRGANFINKASGSIFAPHLYDQRATSGGPKYGGDDVGDPPATTLFLFNIPAWDSPLYLETAGMYASVCATDPDESWRGSVLYQSTDNVEYEDIGAIPVESTMGYVKRVPEITDPHYWDRVSELEVELLEGTLASATEEEVLNGSNLCVCGGEILQFKDAELIGTRKYRLTNLIRGRRGTEHEVGNHSANEYFVLLRASGMEYASGELSLVGASRYYKAPSVGGDLADYTEQEFTIEGATLKPFSPVQLQTSVDTSGNITLSWVRRSRDFVNSFLAPEAPIHEDELPERYEIDLRASLDDSTVLRTIVVEEATSLVYSIAEQIEDGYGGDGTGYFNWHVHQMSNKVGRGFPSKLRETLI